MEDKTMLNKKNVANNWKEIVKVFNSTRETNPNITAKEIVNQIGYDVCGYSRHQEIRWKNIWQKQRLDESNPC